MAQEGQPLSVVDISEKAHETSPPQRFSEGSLVKRLEELGIGRPSTYAPIINLLQVTPPLLSLPPPHLVLCLMTNRLSCHISNLLSHWSTDGGRAIVWSADLQARGYVSKQGGSLKAEGLGRVLTAFLRRYFPDYLDFEFTANLEARLDDVSGDAPTSTTCSTASTSFVCANVECTA